MWKPSAGAVRFPAAAGPVRRSPAGAASPSAPAGWAREPSGGVTSFPAVARPAPRRPHRESYRSRVRRPPVRGGCEAGARRQSPSSSTVGSPPTPTATSSFTPCAMPCSVRPASATSAGTFPTRARSSPVSTAGSCSGTSWSPCSDARGVRSRECRCHGHRAGTAARTPSRTGCACEPGIRPRHRQWIAVNVKATTTEGMGFAGRERGDRGACGGADRGGMTTPVVETNHPVRADRRGSPLEDVFAIRPSVPGSI